MPSFSSFSSSSVNEYYSSPYADLQVVLGLYLAQVFLEALVRGSEQSSDAEAVGIFLVSDARLFQ